MAPSVSQSIVSSEVGNGAVYQKKFSLRYYNKTHNDENHLVIKLTPESLEFRWQKFQENKQVSYKLSNNQ